MTDTRSQGALSVLIQSLPESEPALLTQILLLCLAPGFSSPERYWWTCYAKLFVALSSTPKIGLWAEGFLQPPKAACSIRSAPQHYRQQKRKLLSELTYSQARFAGTSRAWSCTTFKVCSTKISVSAERHIPDLSLPIKTAQNLNILLVQIVKVSV